MVCTYMQDSKRNPLMFNVLNVEFWYEEGVNTQSRRGLVGVIKRVARSNKPNAEFKMYLILMLILSHGREVCPMKFKYLT